ncbi:MAG: hypothetical protein Q9O62_04250 [Ardenticatenia bacterium]|nr:hypothetical protein [Ardenticatenia bacterium]
MTRRRLLLAVFLLLMFSTALPRPALRPAAAQTGVQVFLPLVTNVPPCTDVGETYATLSINGAPSDRPAEQHPDLNLAIRGYEPTDAFLGLVSYGGATDAAAPQLYRLFTDQRIPTFSAAYQVYDWDWNCDCRGSLLSTWEVTLAGLATAPGEIIHLPGRGVSIGSGYEALVLYATEERLTIKYTREDNVVYGYTLHLENLCVDSNLLATYRAANAAGRSELPALRAGQPLGRARGQEIKVAIRDNGTFMDPRSAKDWWQQ